MKTLIAIPCMDTMPVGFVQSLVHLDTDGLGAAVQFQPNTLIYDARNRLSIIAIEKEYDRVLWLDSDMVFLPDTLRRLSEIMDTHSDCEMVTGLYVKRREPCGPVIYDMLEKPGKDENGIPVKRVHEYSNYPRNSLFTVRGCGFGCVLTSVKLLKAVWDNFGPAFSPFVWCGEDLSFCHRVNELGYPIYCDSSILCGHIGQYVYTEEMLKRGDGN